MANVLVMSDGPIIVSKAMSIVRRDLLPLYAKP
jgi:hypothetical protein